LVLREPLVALLALTLASTLLALLTLSFEVEGYGEGYPPPHLTRGSGEALWDPPAQTRSQMTTTPLSWCVSLLARKPSTCWWRTC